MTKHEKREQIYLLLFETEFNRDKTADEIINDAVSARDLHANDYIKDVYTSVYRSTESLDSLIKQYAENWSIERMSPSVRSILRLATYEIMFTDTPPKVAINEALELAKVYDAEASASFINGILNKLARTEGKLVPSENEQ